MDRFTSDRRIAVVLLDQARSAALKLAPIFSLHQSFEVAPGSRSDGSSSKPCVISWPMTMPMPQVVRRPQSALR